MNQLPIFVNLSGRKVLLIGEGEAADAKRRLIERAGGICVSENDGEAQLAFVAGGDVEQLARALRKQGLMVNVTDRPDLCDFTMPSIVDRSPVLVAIGTGGASAGMAKMLRQRIETFLPQSLGGLANAVAAARDAICNRWPDAADRRRALDAAFAEGAPLDPMREHEAETVEHWLQSSGEPQGNRLIEMALLSNDPDDLTLRQARLLGEADHIFHQADLPAAILARARADAVRHIGEPPVPPPDGLVLHLILPPPA